MNTLLPKKRRTVFSRIVRYSLYTLLTVICLSIGTALFISQTSLGRKTLVSSIEFFARKNDNQLIIGELKGSIFSVATLDYLALKNNEKTWLEIQNMRLDWNFWTLFKGNLSVQVLSAEKVSILRKPPAAPASPDKKIPEEIISNITGFLSSKFWVTIQKAEITTLDLHEPFLGTHIQYTGTLEAIKNNDFLLNMNLKRSDKREGFLRLRASYHTSSDILDIEAQAYDPEKGIFSNLSKVETLPNLSASLKGRGSIRQWQGQLHLNSPTQTIADGSFAWKKNDGTLQLSNNVQVQLSSLVPVSDAPLWQKPVHIQFDAAYNPTLKQGEAHWFAEAYQANIKGTLSFNRTSNTFSGSAAGNIKASSAFSPFIPSTMGWKSADFSTEFRLNEDASNAKVSANIYAPLIRDISAKIGKLDILVSGHGSGGSKKPQISINAMFKDLDKLIPAHQNQAPSDAVFSANGYWSYAGKNLDLPDVSLKYKELELTGYYRQEKSVIDGNINISKGNLSSLSFFFEQPISGNASGFIGFSADLLSQKFNFSSNLSTSDLVTKNAQIDRLTNGFLSLNATIKSNGLKDIVKDLSFVDTTFKTPFLNLNFYGDLDGKMLPSKILPLTGKLTLRDLSILSNNLTGKMTASFQINSSPLSHDALFKLSIPDGSAMGHKIQNLSLEGQLKNILKPENGSLVINGTITDNPLAGMLSFSKKSEKDYSFDLQKLAYRSIALNGQGTISTDQQINGQINLEVGDLNDASPFFLTDLSGRLKLHTLFSNINKNQRLKTIGSLDDFSGKGNSIGKVIIDLSAEDIFNRPQLEGSLEWHNLVSKTIKSKKAIITASKQNHGTALQLNADIQGAALQSTLFIAFDSLFKQAVHLQTLILSANGQSLVLSEPVWITRNDKALTIKQTKLKLASGLITFEADINDAMLINAKASALPLNFVQLFTPNVNMVGLLNADIFINGTPQQPKGHYTFSVNNLHIGRNEQNGRMVPFNVGINGTIDDGQTSIHTNISKDNSKIAITGYIPLTEKKPLNLNIDGTINLSHFNGMLGDSQILKGTIKTNLHIGGSLQQPNAQGSARINDATFTDSLNGIYYNRINATVIGSSDRLVLSQLSGQTRGNGKLSGSGYFLLSPKDGFPGEVYLEGKNARIIDNEISRAIADFSLKISGAMAQSPTISGSVVAQDINITIPDNLPISFSSIPVTHVNPPAHIIERLELQRKKETVSYPFKALLDVRFSVANRIFIRGRGVNAELNGNIHVQGSSLNPTVLGSFSLRRGTLLVLGKTLTFKSGELNLVNSTTPILDFRAESISGDVTTIVTVTGSASKPDFTFSSQPELPQDEVLSRLLFGKSSGSLTTGQTVQLAHAVAQLTGVGSLKILDELSQSLGVDSISVETDNNGNVGLGIGKRINENVYLGFKQGSGQTPNRVTLDIDITEKLKVQGEAGDDGSAAVGIGMEWDY